MSQDAKGLSKDKHARILRGALSVFTELGFERASVDLIANRAGVSKATVYNHFQDKKALFLACVLEKTGEIQAAVNEILAGPPGDLERDLRSLGERFVRFSLSPSAMALRRVIVAEVSRFPELGRAIHEVGVAKVRDGLARFFQGAKERGELEIADPRIAAMQFLALCHSDLEFCVELGVIQTASEEEIRTAVDQAVALLVRAYRA
jgi:AcrR family transcriptional regulator